MVVSRRATQGPPYRGFPVEHCRAGSACPTAFNRGTSSNLRRGRCPHRPADRRKRSYILHRQRQRRRSRDDTKFRTRPAEPLLVDRKGSQETMGFLRIFGYFLCAQKVPRRRHGPADSATDPVKTQKNRRSKNAAAAGIRCNALDYAPPGRVSQVITCTGFSRWVVSSMLLRFQLPAAYGSREACDPHTDPTSPITKCEDKKGLSRTAQGAGTASAALTDIV